MKKLIFFVLLLVPAAAYSKFGKYEKHKSVKDQLAQQQENIAGIDEIRAALEQRKKNVEEGIQVRKKQLEELNEKINKQWKMVYGFEIYERSARQEIENKRMLINLEQQRERLKLDLADSEKRREELIDELFILKKTK